MNRTRAVTSCAIIKQQKMTTGENASVNGYGNSHKTWFPSVIKKEDWSEKQMSWQMTTLSEGHHQFVLTGYTSVKQFTGKLRFSSQHCRMTQQKSGGDKNQGGAFQE